MKPIRVVDRTVDLLNAFSKENNTLTIDQIIEFTQLPKTTVYRILYTLEQRGLIYYNQKTTKYRLGLKFLEYGWTVDSVLDLKNEAEDILIDLQHKTQQTVVMAIMEDDMIVYIYKRESPVGLKFSTYLGLRRSPLNGASGYVWLAFLPKNKVERILKQPITKMTPYTVTDKEKISSYLKKVREEQFYIDIEKTTLNVTGMAAPVFDRGENIIATVGIIGPSVELVGDKLEKTKKMLKNATKEISLKLNYSIRE